MAEKPALGQASAEGVLVLADAVQQMQSRSVLPHKVEQAPELPVCDTVQPLLSLAGILLQAVT